MASVLLSAGNQAIKAALRAKAATMMNQIQVATMAYYNDYSVYPIGTNAVSPWQYNTGDLADWGPLIYGLCGNVNAYSPSTTPSGFQAGAVANTRSIQYLQLSRSGIDANGIPINPISPYSTNTYFNIALDGAYTGILTNVPTFSSTGITTNNITGGVYLWVNCNSSSSTNYSWWVHAP